ncbi:MAG: DUF4845 domain-containing protein [Acidobacteria bacterium]|nr:DUF4845 domain-containing protein [Acidobacteriota bacterium]
MPKPNKERGFITVTGVIMIFVLVAVIFAAFRLLPPYINNYQLQDSITNIAHTSTYDRSTSVDVHRMVMESARDIGIALQPNQVFAEKANPNVNIDIDYSVTVDLIVKQLDLHFTPSAGNKIITAK